MLKTIIADTSCFIILSNIGELSLLQKVYSHIITTNDIAAEFGEQLPDWVEIAVVKDNYKHGIIPSIKPILEKIKQTDFRLSIDVQLQALKEAGE
jgi:predicted nucleic acid-binding protein